MRLPERKKGRAFALPLTLPTEVRERRLFLDF
jgi:hypothetical protein